MKRFHVHVGVENLEESVEFYSRLFGQRPSKLKGDYAKWMIEDPRINFAISTRAGAKGVDHLGLQVDEDAELEEVKERLQGALYDEGEATCCYAESKKAWVRDPAGIAWEAYRTMGDAETFHGKPKMALGEKTCCAPAEPGKKSCC